MKKIVIKPLITEKTIEATKKDKFTFVVEKLARKEEIKDYVEEVFKVKVISVNTLNNAPELKRNHKTGTYFSKGGVKKAVVTLKKGQKIELFEIEQE